MQLHETTRTLHKLATRPLAWKAQQVAAGVATPKMPNPPVPASTRWHCFDSLLSACLLNQPLYSQVASDSKVQTELGDSFITAVSATHWQKVASIRTVLKAAKDAIARFLSRREPASADIMKNSARVSILYHLIFQPPVQPCEVHAPACAVFS